MELDKLLYAVIALVVVGIVAVIGIQLLDDSREDLITNTAGCNSTDVSSCGAAYNASVDAIEGVAEVPSKLPMIATAVVGILIIGLLLTYLYFKQK